MKKFLLSFLCFLLAIGGGYAEEYSYKFTSKQFSANKQTLTLNEVSWTLDGSTPGGTYFGYDATKGQQFGSSNNPYRSMTLSTSGIAGKITKIVINTSGASSVKASFTVSVGGTQYGNSTTLTTSATDYTFTGSASGEVEFKYTQTSSKALYIKSITITYETDEGGEGGGSEQPETPAAPKAPTLTESCSFYYTMNVEITNIPEGATVYYTTNGTEPTTSNGTEYTDPLEITATTTVKAIAVKDELVSEVVSTTYTKIEIPAGHIIDVLNRDLTGVTSGSTTYTLWDNKKSNSCAVYMGESAGSHDAIQLRNDPSKGYSGIITTKSGGKVKKIIVDWSDKTVSGRVLDIYGKKTAYSEPQDLYKDDTKGTYLGSINKGESTELEIEGDFYYVGLLSNKGAMYINSITIIWEEEVESDIWHTFYYSQKNIDIPVYVKAYVVSAANSNSVSLTQIKGAIPKETAVIYNGDWEPILSKDATNEVPTIEKNLLKGTDDTSLINQEAYVLSKVDDQVGFYKAEMNQQGGKAFYNRANKAYLPVSALPVSVQNAKALKFDFNTTAVENVKVETEGKKVIFDLSGRRVNEMTQPGIYIVNGKKVMVK